MHYSSYGANTGEFFQFNLQPIGPPAACRFTGDGLPTSNQMNGVIYILSHVGIAAIADGTSNTLLFSERAHSKLPDEEVHCWNWWTSGNYGDTMFCTFYPMNPFNKSQDYTGLLDGGADAFVASASSYPSGGAHFAFCDGSVKFLKDSIDCWRIDPVTGMPVGITRPGGTAFPYLIPPGTAIGSPYLIALNTYIGVYQKLSTRNGGELVSSDQY
jgi:prepilin-type processing-associated H-X9-DG protein